MRIMIHKNVYILALIIYILMLLLYDVVVAAQLAHSGIILLASMCVLMSAQG